MRTIRWVAIALVALLVLGFLARRFGSASVQPGSTLLFELSGDYVEAPDAPLLAQLLGIEQRSLLGTLSELRKAERDERIAHVVLVIHDLKIGWAKAQELRDAIGALREKGRHPIA